MASFEYKIGDLEFDVHFKVGRDNEPQITGIYHLGQEIGKKLSLTDLRNIEGDLTENWEHYWEQYQIAKRENFNTDEGK